MSEIRDGREWLEELPELIPDEPRINPRYLKGLYTPGKYLNSSLLSDKEQKLMSYIHLLDQEHHCYASNKFLASLMRCSEKRIANMLIDLKKKKFIEQVSWNGKLRVMKCL
jgi:hypothetical protein